MKSVNSEWVVAIIFAGNTKTAEIDLGDEYYYLDVEIPTLVSGTLNMEVSRITGGTFADLGSSVTTDTTTGDYMDTWLLGGWRYIKIESSVTQTSTNRYFYVRGHNGT